MFAPGIEGKILALVIRLQVTERLTLLELTSSIKPVLRLAEVTFLTYLSSISVIIQAMKGVL